MSKKDKVEDRGRQVEATQLIDVKSDVGSASTKTNLSAFGVSVTAPADAFEDVPVGSKRRPFSPPPSPTHSTVEVDICDEDFLLS